jgi:hypothetical protein
MIEEIRVRSVSILHPVGPAGWGARSTRWSIRGSGSLGSVADAAITPQVPGSNTDAPLDHDRRKMRRHGAPEALPARAWIPEITRLLICS